MKVYKLLFETNKYAYFSLHDDAVIKRLVKEDWFRTKAMPLAMPPLHVERHVVGKKYRKWPIADISQIANLYLQFAFSQRAVDVLGDFLSPNGTLIPLLNDEAPLYLYHITCERDALDEIKSEIGRFSTGRIHYIDRYCLRPEPLQGATIFALTSRRSEELVTQPFVDRVTEAKLTGFKFDLAWNDEGLPIPRFDGSRIVDPDPDGVLLTQSAN
jgi:hypothetical protein